MLIHFVAHRKQYKKSQGVQLGKEIQTVNASTIDSVAIELLIDSNDFCCSMSYHVIQGSQ